MKPTPSPRSTQRSVAWLGIAEYALRAGFVALLFLAILVPNDTPAESGMFVPQSAGWCLLAMGVSLGLLLRRQTMRWEIVDWLAIAYLLWTAVATAAVWGVGDLRAALNSFFQTAGFVLALLLGRQLLASDEQRRSVLTAMLSLGSAMAVLGLLQFFIFDPQSHAEIRAEPEILLRPLGIYDGDSPEARRALERALSPEPLGTFTLTNSLACFLVAWMIVLVAAVSRSAPHPDPLPGVPEGGCVRIRIGVVSGIAALLLMAACLWLTHSRMSILALIAGLMLLGAIWLHERGWRWLVGGAATACIVVAAAIGVVATVGRDSGLWAAATKSALYRFEYWQSTWQMIVEHWLLGVGLGNFKSAYPQYKLPQASEEIGDPHNFVFEVWATAGTPALLLLMALLVVVLWRTGIRDWGLGTREVEGTKGSATKHVSPQKSMTGLLRANIDSVATLLGAVIALLLVVAVGPIYSPEYPWILAVLTGLFYFALYPRVSTDLLRGPALVVAAVTMLINLLAAGGIGFPCVAIPLALLLALVSLQDLPSAFPLPSSLIPLRSSLAPLRSSLAPLLALIGSAVLYFACYFLCYLPVMRAATVDVAERMDADPLSPEVCRQVAIAELERLEQGSSERLEPMQTALDEAIRRDPRSHLSRSWAGDARLRAFRALQRPELLNAAIHDYSQAAERYPSWSLCHAQLAWALHVAGDDAGAAAAAQEALRLDDLCPHEDRKLRQQKLRDAALSPLRILPLDVAMRRLAKHADAGR